MSEHSNALTIFGAPFRYIQGAHALNEVGKLASDIGKHAVLISDQFVLDLIGTKVQKSCSDAGVHLRSICFNGEVTPNEITRLLGQLSDTSVDVVIAAGGGKGIDIGKAVSNHLNLHVITVPTIASNDAPTSKIYVVYDDSHRLLKVEHMKTNPHAVVVDTGLIVNAPKKLLLAGIGDAISKKFEVAQCYKAGGINIFGGKGTSAANALADLCFQVILTNSEDALRALDRKQSDRSLDSLIEATVLLSGLCFENGGLSIAHSMTRGLSAVSETAHELHGLQVAYGLVVQLHLEKRDSKFLDEIRSFYKKIGLPLSLKSLALNRAATSSEISKIAELTMTAPHIKNFERSLTQREIEDAMHVVESNDQ